MGLEMDRLNRKQKSPVTAWLPVLGLVLALAMGVLAYMASPVVVDYLTNQSSRFPPADWSDTQVRYAVTGFIFVVFLLVSWTIVAAFIPKKKSTVSEKDLIAERKSRDAEKRARKKRQQKIREAAARDLNRD